MRSQPQRGCEATRNIPRKPTARGATPLRLTIPSGRSQGSRGGNLGKTVYKNPNRNAVARPQERHKGVQWPWRNRVGGCEFSPAGPRVAEAATLGFEA